MARYSARAPVAESRLRYDADHAEVELVSDRNDGPYAGIHRFSALEFFARWVDHVPDRYETRVRYYGAYATRRRVWWQRRGISLASVAAAEVVSSESAADWLALVPAGGAVSSEKSVPGCVRARVPRASGGASARDPVRQASLPRGGGRTGDPRVAATRPSVRPGGRACGDLRGRAARSRMRVPIHCFSASAQP